MAGAGELGDVFPVAFPGAVDNGALKAEPAEFREDRAVIAAQARVLEMVVRVEIHQAPAAWAANAWMARRT